MGGGGRVQCRRDVVAVGHVAHGGQAADLAGHTLAAVTWTEADLRGLGPKEQAGKAGQLLADRAKAVRWGKAQEILSTWLITIPGAGLVGVICYLISMIFTR